jgi:hypothetical protein
MGSLYAVASPLKFHSKKVWGREYATGAAEGLWWADDPSNPASGSTSPWQWALLRVLPTWMAQHDLDAAVTATKAKAGLEPAALQLLHLLTLVAGQCLDLRQTALFVAVAVAVAVAVGSITRAMYATRPGQRPRTWAQP